MYHVLNSRDLEELCRKRIAYLEAEHYTTTLLLAESPEGEQQQWKEKLDELERRIAIHQFPSPSNYTPTKNIESWQDS